MPTPADDAASALERMRQVLTWLDDLWDRPTNDETAIRLRILMLYSQHLARLLRAVNDQKRQAGAANALAAAVERAVSRFEHDAGQGVGADAP